VPSVGLTSFWQVHPLLWSGLKFVRDSTSWCFNLLQNVLQNFFSAAEQMEDSPSIKLEMWSKLVLYRPLTQFESIFCRLS
jgi:hypothetical protein